MNPLSRLTRKLGGGPGSIPEWTRDGEQAIVRHAGHFSSEDIHKALFGRKPPQARTDTELKEGIRSYIQKRYTRG